MIVLKILFKNTTKYSKSIYTKFLQFHKKQYGLKYSLYTALISFLLLFCIIVQLKVHNIALIVVFCTIIVCFFLWRYVRPITEVNKEFQSQKIQSEEEFTFVFYEKYFKILGKSKTYSLKYYQLYKIFETDSFFYLYIDSKHSLLLDKNSFLIGSSNDFSNFIHKKCWYKFKKVK